MLNRRDFVRLAAAASAATSLPANMLPQAPKKIRYAAVGLGRISCQHIRIRPRSSPKNTASLRKTSIRTKRTTR